MYPFNVLVEAGLRLCGDEAPLIASMEEIPLPQLLSIINSKRVSGAVLFSNTPATYTNTMKGIWTNQKAGRWQLERTNTKTILFLGYRWNIGLHMLLEAMKYGYNTIVYLKDDGVTFDTLSVPKTLTANGLGRSLNRLIASFQKLDFLKPIGEYMGRGGFRKAYEEMYVRLSSFGLDISPDEVISGKVLMHIGTLGPGGAERQLVYSSCGVDEDDRWQPTVLVDYLNNDVNRFHLPTLKKAGIRVIETPLDHESVMETKADSELYSFFINNYRHTGFQNLTYQVLAYVKILHKEKPEIVHCWMDASNVLFGMAASIVGVPKIILSCRSAAPDNFEIFQPYMKPGYQRLIGKENVTFLNNSKAGAIDYARWLKQDTDFQGVIHNGFNFPKITKKHDGQAVRKKLGIPKKALVLGSIIRFSEEKQPELMINAIKNVIESNKNCYGVIFGDGLLRQDMLEYTKNLGLQDRILLPGYTKDTWKSLGAMDLFLLTSRMEGLPNVLVEAQGMGLPVVTTGRGGMRETYVEGESGLTAPSATASDIANCCLSILSSKEKLEAMGSMAIKQSRDRFSVDRMIQKLIAAYGNGSA